MPLLAQKSSDSNQYYEENAQHFFDTTIGYRIEALYDLFLPHIPSGGRILDAGCGSGRDVKYFLDQGYEVVAFDKSQQLAQLASAYAGIPVLCASFEEVYFEELFDGIWTCASLLHVPKADLARIIEKLKTFLKSGGIWYLSFRYGEGESFDGGRYFNDHTEASLKELLENAGSLEILHLSIPESLRSRRGFQFVVGVVKRVG